jgi:uncharacterized protein
LVRDFQPLFRNPHIATIAGNFWARPKPQQDPASTVKHYVVDDLNTVVCLEQQPRIPPVGHLVGLHGLEGSAHAGYLQSLAYEALDRGFVVHRLNARTCGGTEALCSTMYHSGLTADAATVITQIAEQSPLPIIAVGFSLGGNVVLKLAGEYGAHSPLAAVAAVSAPIDLAECVRRIDRRSNKIYARRFLDRLKGRIRRKSALSPDLYSSEYLDQVHSIWDFDDRFTAPLFGFGTGANYYATQSALNYLPAIQTPTLLIAAQDDPLVPFSIYGHPVISENANIRLVAPQHGGHIGFLSRKPPRFWVDHVVMDWAQERAREYASSSSSTTWTTR